MKIGDLVRVVSPVSIPGIRVGDLAILVEVDWDHRHHPDGIRNVRGHLITGRGWFFFPDRPDVHRKFPRSGERPPALMLIFDNFEVLGEGG